MTGQSLPMGTIADIADFEGGTQPPRSTFSFSPSADHVRLIQIRDYKSDEFKTYIPKALARNRCDADDIMIGRYGPPVFQILRGLEGSFNVALIKVHPRPGVSREYLYQVLKQKSLFDLIDGLSQRSSGQTGVDMGALRSFPIFLPASKEQEAIAEALSDADALIEGLERLIAKKRLIKQGAMQDLLTAKRRLPGFSGEWVETSFGQCFQFLRTGSASRSQLGANLGVGYIHYGDIHGMKSVMLDTSVTRLPEIAGGQVATLSRVQDGDLVIADASEDITDVGKSVEVRGVGDKQIVAGLHTFLLRGNPEIVADGFKAYIQFLRDVRAGIESIATGSSVYGISKKNLAALKFRVPPVREQAAIGQMFADMDAEIQALDTRLEKARQVKEGMMQNLLTGRIRLV
jgi:type I restriction enzyme, S subunit